MVNSIKEKADTSTKIRDHMANERTFLAWVRTSIGMMAFGFVVEKFSLFLKQIAAFLGNDALKASALSPLLQGYSAIFGIILIAFGTFICLIAFINYKKIAEHIEAATYQPSFTLDTILTIAILFIGVFLVLYLFSSV